MRRILIILAILTLLPMQGQAQAANEPCHVQYFNVPIGASVVVMFRWGTKPREMEEQFESEGYIVKVNAGAVSAGPYRIWKLPFYTHLIRFTATSSVIDITGEKDLSQGQHPEGAEVEFCTIDALINGHQPWVKPLLANASTKLAFAGMLTGFTSAVLGPEMVTVGAGVLALGGAAGIMAGDPPDCSTTEIARPVFVDTYPQHPEVDALSILVNRMSRNGSRTYALARAAVQNQNRASCFTNSEEVKAEFFRVAQNQGLRVGRHMRRMNNQILKLTDLLNQAGVRIYTHDHNIGTFNDAWQFFVDPGFEDWWPTLTEPLNKSLLLMGLSFAEIEAMKDSMAGMPPFIWETGESLFPDYVPEGLPSFVGSVLTDTAASLIRKDTD